MHDVVAHSLTVMISLSDGAAVVVEKDPERAGEVLGELSRTGRAALADMRRVLGVLRDDAAPGPRPGSRWCPATTWPSCWTASGPRGCRCITAHSGPALPEDAAFELTVYRIVQESLTNVLRYGRSLSRVDVRIAAERCRPSPLRLDDGRGSVEAAAVASLGSGQGLAGMSERAGIYAGIV